VISLETPSPNARGATGADDDPRTYSARLTPLFRGLNSAGVRWCLLGGGSRLPSAESQATWADDDVELLVAEDDRRLAGRVAVAGRFVRMTAADGGSEGYVAYDRSTDRWIRLDIVHGLRLGRNQKLAWNVEEECLARRQQVGDAFVLAPSDAFWILLLRCLLDDGRIAPRHRDRLQSLAAAPLVGDPMVATLAGGGHATASDAASLVRCIREGDWPEVERLAPLVSRSLKRDQPVGAAVHGATNRALRVLTGLGRVRHPGLSVALMGPDGAGKSTAAAALESTFVLPVSVVYMGIRPRTSSGREARAMPIPARLVANWARSLQAEWHKARGRLVVFDRYPFDALLPPARPIGLARRAGRWVVARACPSPDVVVLLDAPAEVMHRRKAEHPIEVLERRREQYLGLASRLGRVEIVDAGQPPEELRRSLTELTWEAYRRRRHGAEGIRKA